MNHFLGRLMPAIALCMAPVASALADAADPAQSAASAPLPVYRSAFTDYKPLQAGKPGDWRALNDAVKGEGMAGMEGMSGMGKGGNAAIPSMPNMPGLGSKSGHSMPMPMPKKPGSATAPGAGAASTAASAPKMKGMDGMKAMPGMPDMPGHTMPGGKP